MRSWEFVPRNNLTNVIVPRPVFVLPQASVLPHVSVLPQASVLHHASVLPQVLVLPQAEFENEAPENVRED